MEVVFGRKDLLQRALVHRSYLNENPGYALGSNERLEFLGDAVLGFVVAEHLYHAFPEMPEGELTNYRAALVRLRTLARVAERLDLGRFLFLGKGEEASGGRERASLLARSLEAVIGASFLDQGLDATRAFILRLLSPELERIMGEDAAKDDKSRLQELAQAETGLTPAYHTVASLGPDHAKVFVVEVRLGERVLAEGRGRSKQEAEQVAARAALGNWAALKWERQ